jgi:hypothetical protein
MMNSPLSLRQAAINDFALTRHPKWGLLASGSGRFTAYFGRDASTSIMLSLARPKNIFDVPELLSSALISQDTAASLEGKILNPYTEEAPGKKPHEFHDGSCLQERLSMMKEDGWPIKTNEDGTLGMVYYGAGDSTALFNISVAITARAIKEIQGNDKFLAYLRRYYANVKAGVVHDTTLADIDGDGLIESAPQNKQALLNHTWKDSNDAFRGENGRIPPAPYKYLTNNAYFLWSLRESAWIASVLKESEDQDWLEKQI